MATQANPPVSENAFFDGRSVTSRGATSTSPSVFVSADEELQEMDDASKKGWENFTKFLLSNVVMTLVGLLILGALTVWR